MSIESFFNPASLAVVGASRQKGKVGHEIVASLIAGGVHNANVATAKRFPVGCG